jgi:hypothetical protein
MPKKRKARRTISRTLMFFLKLLVVLAIVTLLLMAIVGRFLKFDRYFRHPHRAGADAAETVPC